MSDSELRPGHERFETWNEIFGVRGRWTRIFGYMIVVVLPGLGLGIAMSLVGVSAVQSGIASIMVTLMWGSGLIMQNLNEIYQTAPVLVYREGK